MTYLPNRKRSRREGRFRDAGFSDGQIVEILSVTAENIFTNLLNVVAKTDIDFPVVRASDAA
jgi:hypothetical protein